MWSYRKSAIVPENLESVFVVLEILCTFPNSEFGVADGQIRVFFHIQENSSFRVSGQTAIFVQVPEILELVCGHTENLLPFQKIWNESVFVVLEILCTFLNSEFGVADGQTRVLFTFTSTLHSVFRVKQRFLCKFQKFWNWFVVIQKICYRSRKSGMNRCLWS